MSTGFAHDPHSERGFACPRNLFGIADYSDLQSFEAPLAAKRGGELEDRGVTGRFDSVHLRAIHRYLFQDVFPWAGEFRVVNISKGDSAFGPALYLVGALDEAFDKLKREAYLIGLDAHTFCERAAFYLGEINAIHPFREGNGRTQRELIRQLGVAGGHPLSWAGFGQQEMVDASVASHLRGDHSGLAAILEAALYSTRDGAAR